MSDSQLKDIASEHPFPLTSTNFFWMKDFYKILELTQKSDNHAIRKAYRRLALIYHPDVNSDPAAPKKFIEIGEAYEVLKNPLKRRKYDLLYHSHLNKNGSVSLQRRRKWNDEVNRKQQTGADKAMHNAKQEFKKFKRKTTFSVVFDVFWGVLGFIVRIFEIFTIFG